MLVGVRYSELAKVELITDETVPKTEFWIGNAPDYIHLEVARIKLEWEKKGYDREQAESYAWVSYCLKEIRNVKQLDKDGKEVIVASLPIPEDEKGRGVTGYEWSRIPMGWLVKTFPNYQLIDELSWACVAFNRLTPAEKKTWTWQPKSGSDSATNGSAASAAEGSREAGTQKAPPAAHAGSESESTTGACTATPREQSEASGT